MAAPPIPTFYQCRDFSYTTNRVVPRALDRSRVRFSAASRAPFESVLNYFSEVTFERAGILHGEYVVLRELILVRRDGMCIKANMSWEDASASQAMDDFCNTVDFDVENAARSHGTLDLCAISSIALNSHRIQLLFVSSELAATFATVEGRRSLSHQKHVLASHRTPHSAVLLGKR
ncbi:MAG: hypothetical protein K2Y27_30185 [Xanthobacteraceae bacterium]|nr:hypothetical protein [Xanthobacteraceae bacterium]